jgi:hypothetical protein
VAVTLPSGPILNQKVVYEALPKFCNCCNVLGHTRLLCPNGAANPPPMGIPSLVAGNGSVFHRLGPEIPPSSVSGHGQPLPVQGPSKDSSAAAIVDPEPAPCDDSSDGWIAVDLGENPRSTPVTSPKGRKCLQLQLRLLCLTEVMLPLAVLVWLIPLVQGQ